MSKRKIVSVIGLIFILIVTGCGKPKVDEKLPQQVINTYLEGYRDNKPEKIYNSVAYEVYSELRIPGRMDQIFAEQNAQLGKLKSWEFIDKPYIDEVNNQALIKTKITSSKLSFVFEFDVRRIGDRWYVYGLNQKSSDKMDHSKLNMK